MKYAWEVYAYYQCFYCKKPYFGGRRDCAQNLVEEANPSEYVCSDCANVMLKGRCQTPEHKEFIIWKCRFCCSKAVWFCWGRVHFCDFCHTNDPWGRDQGRYDNDPRSQCLGPGKCPIGAEHPPNGHSQENEFPLGCLLCDNADKKKDQ